MKNNILLVVTSLRIESLIIDIIQLQFYQIQSIQKNNNNKHFEFYPKRHHHGEIRLCKGYV